MNYWNLEKVQIISGGINFPFLPFPFSIEVDTYPLQWYDVFVRQCVSSHGINHVGLDQLLHTLLSYHSTTKRRTTIVSYSFNSPNSNM